MQLEPVIRILLIEDNPGDACLLHEALEDATGLQFDLVQTARLCDALQQLETRAFDVVLLDLSLPDSHGVDTFFNLHAHFAQVPIIVLTSLADETFALRVVGNGGQDYLVKGQIDGPTLVRTIRYAIERHRAQRELQALSLTDDLTGLHNRRGFFTRASRQVKLAQRHQHTCLLAYVDLDGLKRINDTLGHDTGSQAIVDAAQVLSATFRESDIVSRFGGDEFVIMVLDAGPDDSAAVVSRLQSNVRDHNSRSRRAYELSMSIGIVPFDPDGGLTIEAAIARADEAMYQQKQCRHMARGVG
jgi:diguanylate cyclase (GGDEF)-like protein